MQEDTLRQLISDIERQKTEKQTLELKAAQYGFPHKIYDTISSFSNQDDGGIIIFGISESDDYSVTGVYDVKDVQKKVNRCLQLFALYLLFAKLMVSLLFQQRFLEWR